MSYLAQGLMSGFNTGFSATQTRKRDEKAERERAAERAMLRERQLLQDARYEDEMTRRQERQLVEDARYDQQQRTALERDARDYRFARDRAASSDMRATFADARQARQDFSTEIDKARSDPLQMQILTEQARALKMQNDAFGQPKPVTATERLEFDPYDETAPPKRTISGAAGSLDQFVRPPATEQQDLSHMDRVAYEWAKANPDMPQAAQILKRLGLQ
jgi:hypothetical protein